MIRLAVRVRREDAEVALADLLALAPAGVEEVDLPDEDLVEYAVYGAPGELPDLPDLRAAAGGAVVDPGQAFGTGGHATTRLSLEFLLGLPPSGALVDVGCGSGVLAIAAAKLGFSPVAGLDHEREAVAATRANAAVNGVAVDARRWDLRTDPVPAAPVMLANLVRSLLLTLAERM